MKRNPITVKQINELVKEFELSENSTINLEFETCAPDYEHYYNRSQAYQMNLYINDENKTLKIKFDSNGDMIERELTQKV